MARICIVAPHPDDAEIGMGGTIARLADQGHDLLIVDMTDGCPTPVGDRATRLAAQTTGNRTVATISFDARTPRSA